MRNRTKNKRPIIVCLVCALSMILLAKNGGDIALYKALDKIASNEDFVLATLAIETGVFPSFSPSEVSVHVPQTIAEHSESDISSEAVVSVESEYIESESEVETVVETVVKEMGNVSAEVTIKNDTSYAYSIDEMLQNPEVLTATEGPQILIIHAHGTEAYMQEEGSEYAFSDVDRTLDTKYNVIRIGEEMKTIFESRGIETIHVRNFYDYPEYSGSYDRALEEIQNQLEKYPSIQIVIDVHRDSIISEDGTKYKPVCEIDGVSTAQMMLVVGTNEGGLTHDSWERNLNYAVNLQSALLTQYPDLMRSVNLRTQRFNQSARSPGSMLVEVGSSGNTLDEAINAGKLFANTLADQLLANT